MSKSDLRKKAEMAPNTMTKLRRDEEVSLTYEDLHRFESIPANFIEEYTNVIKSQKVEEIKVHCQNLIKEFADFTVWEPIEDEQKQEEKIKTEAVNKITDF